jgi:transposase
LGFTPTPDEVIVPTVERGEHCQAALHTVSSHGEERRLVVDVPAPRLVVREHISQHKQCPHGHQISVAPFPAEVHAPVQDGPTMGAMAVSLAQQHLVPLARVCDVMHDVRGIAMRQATVQGLIARCSAHRETVEAQIKQALRHAEVIPQDETGLHVANRRPWMHVTSPVRLTHDQVHVNRGRKALDAIGMLPARACMMAGKPIARMAALTPPAMSLFCANGRVFPKSTASGGRPSSKPCCWRGRRPRTTHVRKAHTACILGTSSIGTLVFGRGSTRASRLIRMRRLLQAIEDE